MLELVQRMDFELSSFPYSASPEDWENLLTRFQTHLHQNHFLCMKIKRILLQIYGARDGFRLDQMSRDQLNRKIELCRNYIEIFSKLEPGYRVWKGRVLEELLGPLSITVNKDFEEKKISRVEYILRYKEILKMVKEASQCRQFEEKDENQEMIAKFYQSCMKPLTVAAS